MKGKKTVYCGDIGCYTLGNAQPLDMTDTCLCMGADITMAQGFYHNEPDRYCFSFIGDSTFFASGITGVVNAVYNQSRQIICILDNSTTAMTGHQPHPGTGVTMMGEIVEKISIPKILEAIGVNPIIEVDPFDQKKAVEAVKNASESKSVSAVIFKSPCISIASKLGYKFSGAKCVDSAKCIGCQKYIKELGCPALSVSAENNAKGKKILQPVTASLTGKAFDQDIMIKHLEKCASQVIAVDTDEACRKLGSSKVANMVLLGAATKTNLISREELKNALKLLVKPEFYELNVRAIEY